MEIIDYNGTGEWTRDAILDRYARYIEAFDVPCPRILKAKEHEESDRRWIYPVMHAVIDGIEAGDAACIQIGIEFIETDQRFPFGRILKSQTARALRRAAISPEQQTRIRKRVIGMLTAGNTPREYREYAKLLRKIGLGEDWDRVKDSLDLNKWLVNRYYEYFEKHAQPG